MMKLISNINHLTLVLIMVLISYTGKLTSQVKIASTLFSGFNVSPENLCGLTLSGGSGEQTIYIEARITNVASAVIMSVKSNPFTLKTGIINTLQNGLSIANTVFLNSAVGEYVKLYHQLPSGRYNYCVTVHNINNGESDELCDDIESESSTYLSLVSPFDKDTIAALNPLLIWNHTESFNLIQQGEYYRMLLCEMKTGQNAEAAINVNAPLFQKNFLTKHEVMYPSDARTLEGGKTYAWQVQKVVNGVITNKTEAWEFSLKASNRSGDKTFVEITPKLNVTPYDVIDDNIYFVYKEEYSSDITKLRAFHSSHESKDIELNVQNYVDSRVKIDDVNKSNNHSYSVNLRTLGLSEGIYILKILNDKNQEFLLKFRYNNL